MRFTKYSKFTRENFTEECLKDLTHQDLDFDVINKWIDKLNFTCNTTAAFNYLKYNTHIKEDWLVDEFGNPDKETVMKFIFLVIVDSVNFYGVFEYGDNQDFNR